MRMDWLWMLVQSVPPALATSHPHNGHSSLPEEGTRSQRGHITGYSGVDVLGDVTY